jgi:hypothetical protein
LRSSSTGLEAHTANNSIQQSWQERDTRFKADVGSGVDTGFNCAFGRVLFSLLLAVSVEAAVWAAAGTESESAWSSLGAAIFDWPEFWGTFGSFAPVLTFLLAAPFLAPVSGLEVEAGLGFALEFS